MKKLFVSLMFVFLAPVFLFNCKSVSSFRALETIPDDRQRIPKPKPQKVHLVADIIDKHFSYQMEKSLDLSRQLRNVFGKRKQAMNVDAFDEVPDSSWFTNRNAKKPLTPEEVARGPNTSDGPDITGPWTVFYAKEEGVSVGFGIEDNRGIKYFVKFDSPGNAEMATGAEVVSTKFFYAAGYNVPENYIVVFNPSILEVGENVWFEDRLARKRLMTQQDLHEILEEVEHLSDGRLRAIASKFLLNGLGPFKYQGTRADDPNDFIPHEHRRELRGLRVLAAWLNHYDTKAGNSLDVYTDEGFVKHYLIDFGSTIGSSSDKPMPPEIGYETSFDVTQMFINLITLGFNVKPWELHQDIRFSSIGNFTSNNFHPQKYEFINPNPAFKNMTDRDGFWGARLVMSFSEKQIRTAVAEGQYSNPRAAEYLFQTLIERQNIIGRFWFDRMNPLDKFELRRAPDSSWELCFVDLAVESGMENHEQHQYRYDLKIGTKEIHRAQSFSYPPCISLSQNLLNRETGGMKRNSSSPKGVWELTFQKKRTTSKEWSKWVKVYLREDGFSHQFALLGIQRQE